MTGKNNATGKEKEKVSKVKNSFSRQRSKSSNKSIPTRQSKTQVYIFEIDTSQPRTSSSLIEQTPQTRTESENLNNAEIQSIDIDSDNHNSDFNTDEEDDNVNSNEKTPSCDHLFTYIAIDNRFRCLLCHNDVRN